jgi:hypothetical protein
MATTTAAAVTAAITGDCSAGIKCRHGGDKRRAHHDFPEHRKPPHPYPWI